MSFLDTFGDDWVKEAGGEPESEAPEEIEAAEEPDEIEPEEPSEKEPDAEPAAEPKQTPTVPYAEMKREREKRQEAEREIAQLRANQAVPIPQQFKPVALDAYERPDEFNSHFQGEIENLKWEARAEISGIRAESLHGKETVEAAIQWSQEQNARDPLLGVRVRQSADPVGVLVNEYKQSRTLEAIAGRSFEDAARDYAEKQGWVVPQEPKAPNKPSPSAPPRSLASRPGQGGTNQTSGDPFEGIFSSDRMGLRK